MALLRVTPIANFTQNALSTSQNVGYSTAPPAAGQKLYAGLVLTEVSTGRAFVSSVQAASSSGFGTLTTEAQFSLTSEVGSTMTTLTAPSTDQPWRRLAVSLSTASSTAGSWKGMAWVSFK